MLKRHKTIGLFLLICIFFYISYDMPFKATDPNSPYFVESLFRLRDYQPPEGVKELQDIVLPKLFPVGTPKSYVDKMLVTYGNAEIIDKTDIFEGNYTYAYLPIMFVFTFSPNRYFIDVFYDENDRVEAITFAWQRVVGKDYKAKLVEKNK